MSQSVVMRNILGTTRLILPEFPSLSVFRYVSKKNSTIKPFQKETKKSKNLAHTTVIVQDRLDIQEVPTIVRKVKNVDISKDGDKVNNVLSSDRKNLSKYGLEEEKELKEGLQKTNTLNELYMLLNVLPDGELTPIIAVCALEKIIELENSAVYRNRVRYDGEDDDDSQRSLVLGKLIKFVQTDSDSSVLLDSLSILSRDVVGACNAAYKEKLIDEVLIRANDGKFNIHDICVIVNFLSVVNTENRQESIDELWTGLLDKSPDINENNIGEVFRILPKLKQSRKVVFNMLVRKCDDMWWRLPTSSVVEILTTLQSVQMPSAQTYAVLSRNTSANIHTVSEDDLLQIITCFSTSNYVDEKIEGILEKYVKTKCSKVKNPVLLAGILDYCTKFHLRLNTVLEGCAEYLLRNINRLSPITFKSFITPYGYLNYHPSNAVKFWLAVENFLHEKFVQFRPEDIVDVALSCIYLGKFPLNFTKRILNPYFLDRMHSCRSGTELQQLRTKLKVFDTAMTLECPQYQGPLLPRDYAVKSIRQDGRVRSIVKSVYDIVSDIVGTCNRVSTGILLSQLPATELYLVDILLHPIGMGNSLNNLSGSEDQDLLMAILIHLPEHYCSEGKYLIGPQIMKIRHLKCVGVSVVGLSYIELTKLKGKPQELKKHLIDKFEEVEKSAPVKH